MKRWIVWLLIIGLTITGLALIFEEPIKTALVTSYHPQITRQSVKANQHKRVNYNMSQVKAVNMNQVIKARLSGKKIYPVGQIIMPSVGLHLPIALGIDSETLMLAAGTMRPDQQMGSGNYPLAGHHMLNPKALFTPLYNHAQIGESIYLTDMKKVYQYRLNVRKIISPYAVNVINNTKDARITLITCNDSGSKRLLLQGKLVKVMKMKHAPQNVFNEMGKTTNNHDVLKGYKK